MAPQYPRRGGFTLVELTAVAGLIALLTAAAFMTYAQTWRHWALRRDAERFYLAARQARVWAIENGRSYRLVMDPEQKIYAVEQAVEESEPAETDAAPRPRLTRLDKAVTFERISLISSQTADSQECITFRPDGSADGAMVQLGNGERTYTVQISAATARATLMAGAMDEYQPDRIDLDDMQ